MIVPSTNGSGANSGDPVSMTNLRPRGCPSPSDHPMIRRQAADDLSMKT
jgi:hypothetical protein